MLILSQASSMNQNLTSFPGNAAGTTAGAAVTVTDAGLTRTGAFRVSAAAGQICAVDLAFDFQSDAAGNFPSNAQYVLELIEQRTDGSEDTFDDPTPVQPPPVVRRGYTFITV